MKLNGLEKYFKINKNGEIIDFKQINEEDLSPLMYAFVWNKSKQLNLSTEQFNYLIENSELKNMNKYRETPLMYALRYNEEENLNLNSEQWDYLIQNSDLKQVSNKGNSVLIYALENKNEENLNLTNDQWKYLIEYSDISLITDKKQLQTLKKIWSELLNKNILNKINITEETNKKVKI